MSLRCVYIFGLHVGCSCLQLAGAAFGGRDAESKGDEGERETKSAADGEYVRVRVDHASSLGVCLDSSSNLPSNRALFVKVRSHAACAPRRRSSAVLSKYDCDRSIDRSCVCVDQTACALVLLLSLSLSWTHGVSRACTRTHTHTDTSVSPAHASLTHTHNCMWLLSRERVRLAAASCCSGLPLSSRRSSRRMYGLALLAHAVVRAGAHSTLFKSLPACASALLPISSSAVSTCCSCVYPAPI
jgi:hypothetical protein